MRRSSQAVVAFSVAMLAFTGCSSTSDTMRATAGSASGTGSGAVAVGGVGGVIPVGTGTSSSGDAASRPSPKEYVALADLRDINFDFDKYDIRADAAKILEASAAWLKAHPRHMLLVEGYADERGTNEYNLSLGDHRARSAMNYLVSHGVAAPRISRISYGEERGICSAHTESCWAQNRRAHFTVKAQ